LTVLIVASNREDTPTKSKALYLCRLAGGACTFAPQNKQHDEPRYKEVFRYEGEFNKAMGTSIKGMSKETGDVIWKIASQKGIF